MALPNALRKYEIPIYIKHILTFGGTKPTGLMKVKCKEVHYALKFIDHSVQERRIILSWQRCFSLHHLHG